MAIDRLAVQSQGPDASGQFSTFFIEDLFFGVDVLDVQEVLRAQQMTPVPQAPDVVEGLINLRGQIVTAIDMRRRLHMPKLATGQPPMNIVVSTPDGAVSLLVDEIGDVLDMDASNYERPPDNLDPAARELIRGVYKMKDGLMLVLDTEKAIEVDAGLASLNSKLDSQSSEIPASERRSVVQASGANAGEQMRLAQTSTGRSTKKAVVKKNGTQHLTKAGFV
ncbi:MAG: chemotaxis protein CheW [Terracidiphilus sp.]|jgi:purine-binding chemotaxis protein CheW